MKTQHLRQEKSCLNCGHPVPDRYCGHCGQENVETQESFGHLVSHFFQDITHYDSKFLLTLKFLFFYPGLLTKEYLAGKRMTYVNPVRLYVFTSFVFFLMMGLTGRHDNPYERTMEVEQRRKLDSMYQVSQRLFKSVEEGKVPAKDTFKVRTQAEILRIMGDESIRNSAHLYDSVQQSLPPHLREPWWERNMQSRVLEMRDRYGGNMDNVLEDKLVHHYPKLMFLLLPFFALLLKWFFPRKGWLYTSHAIFSIHFHTFIFQFGILCILLNLLIHNDALYAWMILPVYLYFVFALRNAYQVRLSTAFWKSLGIVTAYALGTALVGLAFIVLMFAIS
ncbi:DUF3667 domain-containing protein [Chitinophaga rhizosphaerae]|uniref:DUF3667 domain-containing protein n=1 Tax=Chitinophaga rhizosphaerae TaxID=1864947 RepID=UPI0013DF2ABD|nr:DUF3667 domain-containing protein [Chitinophaga rhizosphaerae]